MSQTDTYNTDATFRSVPLRLAPSSTTYQSKFFLVDAATAIAESGSPDFLEELMWNKTFNTPHVKRGLRRLAAEALQEFAAGETEEGGFAIE